MDVTRTIRFAGRSSREALVLRRMLEDEGVHVELTRGPPELYEADLTERFYEELAEMEARHARERHALEARHAQEQGELADLSNQELSELYSRQTGERSELRWRQHEERYQLEGQRAPKIWAEQVSAGPALLFSDLNQVIVGFVSSGSLMAITAAVKKFRNHAPDSKVEVKDETPGQGGESLQAPHPQSDTS
jgi:hypothetical protein